MLLTRCPHCDTTFRLTSEALHQADGRVRCGYCANIFNAYAELREQIDDGEPPPAATPGRTPPAAEPAVAASSDPAADSTASAADTGPPPFAEPWSPEQTERRRRTLAALWRYGVVAASLALTLQVVHHFRGEIARSALFGPPLEEAYALVGRPLVPKWDVQQYRVFDWVAELDSSGQGNLVITASIQNTGPRAQPYPQVYLELKDRWEEAVASRVFEPREYLATKQAPNTLMAAGDTTRARLTVVDPGPEAYGFELDVCIERERNLLSCAADRVFR
jgi:predicted Zn finger-like uncharacterized protein